MPSQVAKSTASNGELQSQNAPALASAEMRIGSAPFRSILFDDYETGLPVGSQEASEFFTDLNLDQIVDAITAGRDEYDLKPFFGVPLKHEQAIEYRHDILRDLDTPDVFQFILSFAGKMRKMRQCLAQADKLYYNRQKQALFLDAVTAYCGAAGDLKDDLTRAELHSRGFQANCSRAA
ncbi:MAG: hypothetical protein ACRD19_08860 [Terriglobia bacterium]